VGQSEAVPSADGNAVSLIPLAMGKAIRTPAACGGVDAAGRQGRGVRVFLLRVMVVKGGSLVGAGGVSLSALSSSLSSGQGFGPILAGFSQRPAFVRVIGSEVWDG